MTLPHIEVALVKLFDQYHRLKSPGSYYTYKAQPFAVHYPGMDKFIPTMGLVYLVSILDEALGDFITKSGGSKQQDLKRRIQYFASKNLLSDPARLHVIRTLRNSYVHTSGRYSNWQEFEVCFRDIKAELKHLGIVA